MNLEKILRSAALGITMISSPSYTLAGDDYTLWTERNASREERFKNHKLERVFFRGINAPSPNEDMTRYRSEFDIIVNRSSGNLIFDIMKAHSELNGKKLDYKDFKHLERFEINEILAHSQGTNTVYRAIKSGMLKPKRLIIINPPELNLNKWKNLSGNIEVVVLIAKWDPVRFAKYIPSAGRALYEYLDSGKLTQTDNFHYGFYDGVHGVSGALDELASKGEFDMLPSERYAKGKRDRKAKEEAKVEEDRRAKEEAEKANNEREQKKETPNHEPVYSSPRNKPDGEDPHPHGHPGPINLTPPF